MRTLKIIEDFNQSTSELNLKCLKIGVKDDEFIFVLKDIDGDEAFLSLEMLKELGSDIKKLINGQRSTVNG